MFMLGAAVAMLTKDLAMTAIAAQALRWFHDQTASVNWYS